MDGVSMQKKISGAGNIAQRSGKSPLAYARYTSISDDLATKPATCGVPRSACFTLCPGSSDGNHGCGGGSRNGTLGVGSNMADEVQTSLVCFGVRRKYMSTGQACDSCPQQAMVRAWATDQSHRPATVEVQPAGGYRALPPATHLSQQHGGGGLPPERAKSIVSDLGGRGMDISA